ncbi:hypothetical protein PV08_00878 [Exophiala spinifera]|uniref:Heterokaryon incompatibility domain-containing protein n=1 Tax=Exophiala spinifera TaxID=91928 RepID=A0A0D2BMY2_9EURO|nr:uncharacterized protein PV08_00878 [Exophiala spinifera]KIW20303.1 hypothetical protein PV08_00878 [Exophiala spinifera]
MRLLQIQGSTTASASSTGAGGSSKREAPISLRITQYALHRRPPYVAISYTWGNAAHTHEIRVNGRPFLVRANLYSLLWHLRQRGESRFLWIDALCIDQANLEERNFHVQLMGSIYHSADRTIVWLGLPSEDRRQARALEFVAELAAAMSVSDSPARSHGGKGERKPSAATQDNWERMYITGRVGGNTASSTNTGTSAVVAKLEARWRNLLDLCRGVYWTRTWIIQEFLRSPSLEVLVGTAKLDWTLFEVVVGMLKSTSLDASTTTSTTITTLVDQFMHTLPVRLTLRRTHHAHSMLSDLVAEFYDSKCAERRDKIYGILGIADDCSDTEGPQPDYSKHIVEVYFEVYRYLCMRYQYLSRSPPSPSLSGTVPFMQTISLTIRALNITQADIENYLSASSNSTSTSSDDKPTKDMLDSLVFNLRPDYVNAIDSVLPGWTSIRDLRQRLDQVPWEKYVGHEVRRKPSRNASGSTTSTSTSTQTPIPTTPSSNNAATTTATVDSVTSSAKGTEYVRAPLPSDLVSTIIAAATHGTDLTNLHNYATLSDNPSQPQMQPQRPTCRIPYATILSHEEDKRTADNAALLKPSVIIESNPKAGVDPLRLGFACTDVRRGDLICQFRGVDVTLIARRVATGGALKLVGLARMVGHSGLREVGIHPGCKSGTVTTPAAAIAAAGARGRFHSPSRDSLSPSRSYSSSQSGRKDVGGGGGASGSGSRDTDKAWWWWSGVVLPPDDGDDAGITNDVVSRTTSTDTNTGMGTSTSTSTSTATNIGRDTGTDTGPGDHDYTIETDPLSLWELFRPK